MNALLRMAALAGAQACLAHAAHGQPAVDIAKLKPIAIPASPAFTFLGVSPGRIDRPATARAFALSVVGDVASTGDVPSGLAVDVAPWSYLPGVRIPGDAYRTNRLLYALFNTQLSVGSTRAAGDTADTDLSAGLRVTLFDSGDPLRNSDFRKAMVPLLVACLPVMPGVALPGATAVPEDQKQKSEKCASDATERARRDWYRTHWNDASLTVAGAHGWRFAGSRADDPESIGWATWATGSLPLGNAGQVLGQLRYADRDGGSGIGYGGRAYLGTAGANAFVELSRDESAEKPAADWAGGLEFRVPGGLWLSTGFGTRTPPGGGERTVALIADLRLDLRDSPIFGLRP